MTSHKYHFKGEVDEVLFLEDGTAAPMDYKYAEFKDTIYRMHEYQAALYGILIMEHFGLGVKKGSSAVPGAITTWQKLTSGKRILRGQSKLCTRYWR